MALQVWLPLNGNLSNKGLSNVTVTNNGATIDNNGKIGKCYSFNGSNDFILCSQNFLSNSTKEWSYACWMKPNISHNGCLFSCRNSINTSGITIFYFNSQWLIDSGSRWTLTPKVIISPNNWYHVCVTRSNHNLSLYINGILDSSISFNSNLTNVCNTYFTIGNSQNTPTTTTGNPFNGRINDVRIYDHCLNPQEVKEIAKGLVLHYKLNDPEILLSKCSNINWNQYVNNITTYNLTLSSEITEQKYIVTSTINSSNRCIYCNSNITIPTNHKVLIKIVFKSNFTYTPYFRHARSSGNYFSMTCTNYIKNEWCIIEGIIDGLVISSVSGILPSNNNYIQNEYISLPKKGGFMFFDLTQMFGSGNEPTIEEFNIMFPNNYYPYTTGTIQNLKKQIYDCSGYQNNGTITGTLSLNSNTPRYNSCTLAENTSSYSIITYNNFNLPDGQITISFWSKPTISSTEDTSKIDITFSNCHYFTYLNYTYFVHNGDYKYRYVNPWIDGNWHFITCLFNGTDTKIYIDCINVSVNTSSSTNATTFLSNLDIKFRGNNLSDFRIYATALSDEDIIELYNTAAFVTDNGMAYEYELYEEDINIDINSKGVVKINNFYEDSVNNTSEAILGNEQIKLGENYITSKEYKEI